MNEIIKFLPPQMLLLLLSMILTKVGTAMKNKDSDAVGREDAFGNVLLALAPAIAAFDDKSENAFKKALKVVYQTLGTYLGETSKEG